MRGIPSKPITCVVCGSAKGYPKDGLCIPCRMQKKSKYVWTPALDDELRRIYIDGARSRKRLTSSLRIFRTRLGWPRGPIAIRAVKLRITVGEKQRWSPREDELLQLMSGRKSMTFMMKSLRRSASSIHCRLTVLGLSSRFTEGYSRSDLCEVFGVSRVLVAQWTKRGWLPPELETGRVPEKVVRSFLRKHAEEYDLKRVDQAWFKGMIFQAFGQHAHGMGDNASRNPYQEVA